MYWDVTALRIVDDKTLFVQFRDGVAGPVVFEPTFFTAFSHHCAIPHSFAKRRSLTGSSHGRRAARLSAGRHAL
jgi:hypothetical protein